MSAPIVCAETWRAVMAAAGGRCQCTGQCGQRHPAFTSPGRCPAETDGPARFLAAPADLALPVVEAARVPVGELLAWCSECHGKAASRQRRAAKAKRAAQLPDALFDL